MDGHTHTHTHTLYACTECSMQSVVLMKTHSLGKNNTILQLQQGQHC